MVSVVGSLPIELLRVFKVSQTPNYRKTARLAKTRRKPSLSLRPVRSLPPSSHDEPAPWRCSPRSPPRLRSPGPLCPSSVPLQPRLGVRSGEQRFIYRVLHSSHSPVGQTPPSGRKCSWQSELRKAVCCLPCRI